jgi:tetratricopeptide (TPR) repeat protein
VANTLNNLALVKEDLGDFQGAKTYHDRALEIRQSISPDHPACAQSLNNLAVWYHRQGDVPRAKELGKQALEIWQRALGAGHPESIQAKLDWGGD